MPQKTEMKKQITLGEALGFAITILIVVVTSWVTQSKEVARHDERLKILEQSREEMKIDIKEMKHDQQENFIFLSAKLETILLKLENKADKK